MKSFKTQWTKSKLASHPFRGVGSRSRISLIRSSAVQLQILRRSLGRPSRDDNSVAGRWIRAGPVDPGRERCACVTREARANLFAASDSIAETNCCYLLNPRTHSARIPEEGYGHPLGSLFSRPSLKSKYHEYPLGLPRSSTMYSLLH